MYRPAAWVLALFVTSVSSVAVAQTEAEAGPAHDGFMLRLGLGAGWFRERFDVTSYAGGQGASGAGALAAPSADERVASGPGVVTEVALGGSPIPGLVVGGGLEQTGGVLEGAAVKVRTLSVAPFVDYYPNPRRGLHFLAAPSLALMTSTIENGWLGSLAVGETTSTGIAWGGSLGAGYDGWVSRRWSLGALLRVQYLTRNVSLNQSQTLLLPSLSFVATFDS